MSNTFQQSTLKKGCYHVVQKLTHSWESFYISATCTLIIAPGLSIAEVDGKPGFPSIFPRSLTIDNRKFDEEIGMWICWGSTLFIAITSHFRNLGRLEYLTNIWTDRRLWNKDVGTCLLFTLIAGP